MTDQQRIIVIKTLSRFYRVVFGMNAEQAEARAKKRIKEREL